MGLEDYKEIVAASASITTTGQMFAGTLVCKDIYKKGSAEGFDPMPFLGGIGMSILMLQYALIMKDAAMINVNVVGLLLNLAYMTFYYFYSPDKTGTLASVGKALVFVAVLIAYAQVENPNNIEFRFGIVITVLLLILIASPLLHLGEIIRTKSTARLPFPLIFMGTIVTSQWLLYGLIIDNGFIIFQNAVAFTLSVAQLSLFAIYPSTSATETNSEGQKKKN